MPEESKSGHEQAQDPKVNGDHKNGPPSEPDKWDTPDSNNGGKEENKIFEDVDAADPEAAKKFVF